MGICLDWLGEKGIRCLARLRILDRGEDIFGISKEARNGLISVSS